MDNLGTCDTFATCQEIFASPENLNSCLRSTINRHHYLIAAIFRRLLNRHGTFPLRKIRMWTTYPHVVDKLATDSVDNLWICDHDLVDNLGTSDELSPDPLWITSGVGFRQKRHDRSRPQDPARLWKNACGELVDNSSKWRCHGRFKAVGNLGDKCHPPCGWGVDAMGMKFRHVDAWG